MSKDFHEKSISDGYWIPRSCDVTREEYEAFWRLADEADKYSEITAENAVRQQEVMRQQRVWEEMKLPILQKAGLEYIEGYAVRVSQMIDAGLLSPFSIERIEHALQSRELDNDPTIDPAVRDFGDRSREAFRASKPYDRYFADKALPADFEWWTPNNYPHRKASDDER